MRRTGKALDSPATAIEACGGGGMTNEVALMKDLGWVRERERAVFTRLRGPALEWPRRVNRRGLRDLAAELITQFDCIVCLIRRTTNEQYAAEINERFANTIRRPTGSKGSARSCLPLGPLTDLATGPRQTLSGILI